MNITHSFAVNKRKFITTECSSNRRHKNMSRIKSFFLLLQKIVPLIALPYHDYTNENKTYIIATGTGILLRHCLQKYFKHYMFFITESSCNFIDLQC